MKKTKKIIRRKNEIGKVQNLKPYNNVMATR